MGTPQFFDFSKVGLGRTFDIPPIIGRTFDVADLRKYLSEVMIIIIIVIF